jgi:hypothetical protein
MAPSEPMVRCSGQTSPPPPQYEAPVFGSASFATHEDEIALNAAMESPPQSFKEAMDCPDAHHWLQAMIKELNSITRHEVWQQAACPTNINVVKCRWVHVYK